MNDNVVPHPAVAMHLEDLEPDPIVVDALDWRPSQKSPTPLPTLLNAYKVLSLDRRWRGRFVFDEFASFVRFDGSRLRDVDVIDAAAWLDAVYGVRVQTHRMHEAIQLAADRARTHPVREYLAGLTWDGVERTRTWLTDCLGVQDTLLTRVIGHKFLVGCVARVMRPGCKLDTVLVLCGPQGRGKSSAIRTMSDPWFSDTDLNIGSKDVYQQIQGVWLQEVAELQAFRGREATAIKSFITSPVNRYRPPYGREMQDIPRQTVFVATTNDDDFLVDPTGHRRFQPVTVGEIDLDRLRQVRDQLWAEARLAFEAGEPWHLDRDEAHELVQVHRQYESTDAWHEPIVEWLRDVEPGAEFRICDLAHGALSMAARDIRKADEMRIAKILRRLGFHKVRRGAFREVFWTRD